MFDSPTVAPLAVEDRGHSGPTAASVRSRRPWRDDFVVQATRFLQRIDLAQALAMAGAVKGYWHPTGFMAFHTRWSFEGMPVRVHCWPRGARPVEDRHPPLHDHMWPLASKVLTGTYSETVYALDDVPDGEYAHYSVEYHTRDDATVFDDRRRCQALPVVTSVCVPGEVHHLEAGVFHETTIPESQRVVTVMVTGQREMDSCSLVGLPGFPTRRRVRRSVTPAELARAIDGLPASSR